MANYNSDRFTIGENTYRVKDTISDYATNTALADKQDKIENLSYVALSTLEATSNKVTSWSATTTDTNYPSEKLVKDSLNNKQDAIENLSYINLDDVVPSTRTVNGKALSSNIEVDYLPYVTSAPTANNPNGLKFALLDSDPATKYTGWIYLIKES